MRLPEELTPREFARSYLPHFETWRHAVEDVALAHGLAGVAIEPCGGGSNLVARVGAGHVVKLFPPFHRHQWESERRVLERFRGALPIAVPDLLAAGERADRWTYVLATLVRGITLEARWPTLTRVRRAELMSRIGAVMSAAHALAIGTLADLGQPWAPFLESQLAGCRARHMRLGMPEWIVDHAETFARGALAALPLDPPHVILTGEYTPSNLLVLDTRAGPRLTGMIDFGDARIGPPVYDLLGPATFLAAGDPFLLERLVTCHGHLEWPLRPEVRRGLLALLLVHRHSDLDLQLRVPEWRSRAQSLEELAEVVWPS